MLLAGLFTGALAQSPIHPGTFPPGANDGITDVPGVTVAHVTKIEGSPGPLVPGVGPVRTGATAVVPNGDPWNQRVAAASYTLNGNGEMTGTHWVDQSGFLEVPIVLTDTLDVGRADDGVVSWMIKRYPGIGVRDDVPLPVVAECDDQGLNDIQGRHVHPEDVVNLLDHAHGGQFERGDVGAGTGMRAYGFKAGIGSASRVLPKSLGGYTVGVLVNLNTSVRRDLVIEGVPVGRLMQNELLPSISNKAAVLPTRGRAADGSFIMTIATDAPLDSLRLHDIAVRAALGVARTGTTSFTSSGDLLLAFSTTHVYPRAGGITGPALETEDERIDALFDATADAAEEAVYDALFSARTMSGARGLTFYALPWERAKTVIDGYRR